jgi:hypothetical protein
MCPTPGTVYLERVARGPRGGYVLGGDESERGTSAGAEAIPIPIRQFALRNLTILTRGEDATTEVVGTAGAGLR